MKPLPLTQVRLTERGEVVEVGVEQNAQVGVHGLQGEEPEGAQRQRDTTRVAGAAAVAGPAPARVEARGSTRGECPPTG